MNEIRINPIALLIVLLAAAAVVVGTQLPEIKRYLKVRSM
jgi:hypothetical protein